MDRRGRRFTRRNAGRSTKKLIAGVVAVVDEDAQPPAPLVLAWLCGPNHLPDSGGLHDQDYNTIAMMTVARNVHNAMSRLRNAQGAQIHQLTNEERKIIRKVLDMGLLY